MFTENPPERPATKPTCPELAPNLDAVTAVATGLMTIVVLSALMQQEEGDPPFEIAGAGAVITGGFIASASLGFGRARQCNESWSKRPAAPVAKKPVPFAPFVEAVPAKDPAAAQLTREAHDAAREGRCAPTAAVGPRVKYLDPEYHDKVFLADDAIARCR